MLQMLAEMREDLKSLKDLRLMAMASLGGSMATGHGGTPNSWMVDFVDDEWGTPISGNLQTELRG